MCNVLISLKSVNLLVYSDCLVSRAVPGGMDMKDLDNFCRLGFIIF